VLLKGLGVVLASLAVWVAPAATADVMYTYTGPAFTTAVSPYTTSDFLTITLQLPDKFAGNLSNFTVCNGNCAITFSATDGVDTISNNNGQLLSLTEISTNAAGIPIQWFISSQNNSVSPLGIISKTSSAPNDVVVSSNPSSGCPLTVCASVNYTAGPQFWSVASVPEPSPLSLSVIGLALFAGVTRRRRA